MPKALNPTFVRRRGHEDFYLGGSLELKGGLLVGGDIDMAGFNLVNYGPTSIAASDVFNDSIVAGATVKDALDALSLSGSFSPLTTKGDLFGFGVGNERVPVGADGAILVADAASPQGVKWGFGVNDVLSVHGRTGHVFAVLDDYQATLVTNDSGVTGATVADALDELRSLIVVDSVHGRTGDVVSALSDYDASQIDNDSTVQSGGATVKTALEAVTVWRNGWAAGTYLNNEMVRDGDWLMVANKTTTDRAAPQEDGNEQWTLPETPAWTGPHPSHLGVVESGASYEITEPITVVSYDIWAPLLSPDHSYTVRVFSYPTDDPASIIYREVSAALLLENQWTSVATSRALVSAGTTIGILLTSLNSGSDTVVGPFDWGRDVDSNINEPPLGDWNRNNGGTVLRISKTDDTAADRTGNLTGVIAGSTVQIVNKADALQSATYETTTSETDTGTAMEWGASLRDTGVGGPPPVGVVCVITITVPLPSATDYAELPGGGTASAKGVLRFDGVDQPGADLNAYGVRVLWDTWTISPDWDIANTSGGGGGGSPAPIATVFTRVGDVVAVLNDYAASLVDNDSTVTGATVKDALETLAAAGGGGIPTAGAWGANVETIVATKTLTDASPTLQILSAAADQDVELPELASLTADSPFFEIINDGAGTLTVIGGSTYGDATWGVIPPEFSARCWTDGATLWRCVISPVHVPVVPPPPKVGEKMLWEASSWAANNYWAHGGNSANATVTSYHVVGCQWKTGTITKLGMRCATPAASTHGVWKNGAQSEVASLPSGGGAVSGGPATYSGDLSTGYVAGDTIQLRMLTGDHGQASMHMHCETADPLCEFVWGCVLIAVNNYQVSANTLLSNDQTLYDARVAQACYGSGSVERIRFTKQQLVSQTIQVQKNGAGSEDIVLPGIQAGYVLAAGSAYVDADQLSLFMTAGSVPSRIQCYLGLAGDAGLRYTDTFYGLTPNGSGSLIQGDFDDGGTAFTHALTSMVTLAQRTMAGLSYRTDNGLQTTWQVRKNGAKDQGVTKVNFGDTGGTLVLSATAVLEEDIIQVGPESDTSDESAVTVWYT